MTENSEFLKARRRGTESEEFKQYKGGINFMPEERQQEQGGRKERIWAE